MVTNNKVPINTIQSRLLMSYGSGLYGCIYTLKYWVNEYNRPMSINSHTINSRYNFFQRLLGVFIALSFYCSKKFTINLNAPDTPAGNSLKNDKPV